MIETKEQLEVRYATPDPWGVKENLDDAKRFEEILGAIPKGKYKRALDVGCGEGVLTVQLPADEKVGIDISERAIGRCIGDAEFKVHNLLEDKFDKRKKYDLIVIAGVLYEFPQRVADDLIGILKKGGILVDCHINQWSYPSFEELKLIKEKEFSYSSCNHEYTQQLKVYKKV